MPERQALPLDEADLVARSREGDLTAFNTIVAAYQDRVYSLCLRMLGSPQAAEDATQDAFVSAYKGMQRLRGGLRSWLFRIASNACIDEIRRAKRKPAVSLDASKDDDERLSIDPPDATAGPEALALQGELSEALQVELMRLPSDQRLAVVLCDIEQLGYDEIAASMGSSVGTVKSRISRGRARLRDRLRQRPELFGDLIRHMDGGG